MDFQPMSPEEMQRAMQFVLNQQAQFATDLSRQRELFAADMDKLSAKTDRIADGLIGLTSIVGQVVGSMNTVKPTRRVVLEMIEEFIDVVQRLEGLLEDD